MRQVPIRQDADVASQSTSTTTRPALTRERVLLAAVEVADDVGVHALTMRRLADALESSPMTLYTYVANKEALLDGIVDVVFSRIDVPSPEVGWREAMRARCRSARAVLVRHPWAVPLLESRTSPGPATLQHHDAVLACLMRDLPLPVAAHAFAVLDAFVFGFVVQETTLPTTDPGELADLAERLVADLDAADLPHLARFTAEHVLRPGYSFTDSFEVGLEMVLDGIDHLDRAADAASA